MSKKTTTTNYKSRLLKTPEQAKNELIDNDVKQASIAMKMGLLSIESNISTANGEVLKSQNALSTAQKELDNAKASNSEELVQNLINAYKGIKQAEANLEAVKKDLEDLYELQSFLIETQAELF